MNGNAIPRILGHVTARTIGGEVFLMNRDTTKTYSFNETASFAWGLIDGSRTVDNIVVAALDEYDVPEEDCRNAIAETLETFISEGLVSLAGPDD